MPVLHAHPDPIMSRASRRLHSISIGALLAVAACGRSAPPADLGFVTRWTKTHYALARAERLSPPVASRLTAYAAVALYEGRAALSDRPRRTRAPPRIE